jgi:DNA-directed RNA polymerase specialized sigma24 family protein
MPSLAQPNQQAANLYWLAFLLTGDRKASINAAVETIESPESNPFFLGWMMAWSRKVIISKALTAIRQELAASAGRMALERAPRSAPPLPRNWSLAPGANRLELERALLAIDAFPRGVLLLLLFEGLSVDDAMQLLGADRDLIRKAQAVALQQLTRNLAATRETARA